MKRLIRLAAAAATVAVTVTACGTTEVEEPAAAGSAAPVSQTCANDTTTTATGPVSMTDGVGRTVKLDKPAQRVAVLEWQQTEDLLTLCLNPVAVADPKGYATYVKAETLPADVADAGQRGEPDLDALYATNPDLIVVEAFKADDELITKLEKRGVPVLATVGADASGQIANMKKVFSMIGTATGRTERADLVLQQFDKHLAEAKQKVANAAARDFLFFDGWIEGGNVVIRPYGEGALFTELGEQLGMTPAWTEKINAAYGSGGVDPSYGLAQTDIEGLTAVGNATLFYSDDATPDSYVKELTKSPIWTALPAVKEKRAYAFPAGVWGAGGPLSNEQAIDAYVKILTQA
ncbi:putative ABC transporter substrate-binding protein [Actinoplanes missouriensis 431]|uniref:Putative ABC transporter substrate-binding protein n=1 Tax=Actinoplanes missouriensis (strain ATCC 14538 / DSM 43046 / CBS 188.64 / JCM 3121 / NBRC 102363 / NCIMB 12654 / NRRL B-3342 / UNCC 431) TaxID=512565 RepID=I0H9J5_ACTM4|nr:iron-siderophore ABC transporter substrate-binding protein [Actinoplanes missouriensis]BAL89682.1 putative ABC transporter substrate-binding protein [Actinoplanes missouriensis 431]